MSISVRIGSPLFAPLAQRIERLASDQKVGGSNPSGRATIPGCGAVGSAQRSGR